MSETPSPSSPPSAGDGQQEELAFADSLLHRGLPSPLARRVADAFAGWPALASAAPEHLRQLFTATELESMEQARRRRAIPAPTVRRLLGECDSRCCLCWNLDSDFGVVIHHLRPHAEAPDDRYENLIVLCPNHHSVVHTVHELDRHPYPPDLLRRRKAEFADAIAAFKAGRRPAPGREREDRLGRFACAPPPSAHFIGRTALVASAADDLARGHRRVAFVGMGGVGKTALALKVVDAARGEFPGGVCWFEAEPGRSTIAPLLRCLLSALGSNETGLDPARQTALVQALLLERTSASGDLLLAIDNAGEEDLDGLVRLAAGLPKSVAMLVTSRETTVAAALNARPVALDPLERADAGALLSAISGSTVAAGGGADVDRLLGLLGDLPLAVELVARQLAIRGDKPGFSLAVLCGQLEKFNSELLSFPGHRGIAMSFALSYDSLGAPVRALFRTIGGFAEGPLWARDVASVADLEVSAAEPLLDRLVVVSMLQWCAGPGGYRAHPLLHKYAGFLLGQADQTERAQVGARFRGHFLSGLEASAKRGASNLGAIDAVFGNLAKAVRDSAAAGEHDAVCRSMLTLVIGADYFQRRNLELESVPLVELAIVSARKLGEPDREAAHIGHLGNAWSRLGEIGKAKACYEKAAAMVRRTGNREDLASNLQNLGQAMLSEGADPRRIEKVFREALDAARRSGNLDALFGIFSGLGSLCKQTGRLDDAAHFHEAALGVARQTGNRRTEGNSLSNLGLVRQAQGDEAEGERLISEALAIAREIGDKRGEGNRMGHLGGFALRRAQDLGPGPERSRLLDEARAYIGEAVRLAKVTRDPEKIATWTMNLGNVHLTGGDPAGAESPLTEALDIAETNGYALIAAQARFNLGAARLKAGRLKEAWEFMRAAQAGFHAMGSPMAANAKAAAEYVESLLTRRH